MRRRRVLAGAGFALLTSYSGCLGNITRGSSSVKGPDRWSQYGFDAQNTNHVPGAVGPQEGIRVSQMLTEEPPLSFPVGDDHFYYHREEADPWVGGGTVDVPGSYATDGTERWAQSDALGHVVALADDRVIVRNNEQAKLHGLSAADGDVEWSLDLPDEPRRGYPSLVESELYLQTTAGFVCVDLTEPAVKWQATPVDHPEVSPDTAPRFLKPVVTDERVISHDMLDAGDRRRVFAFDRSTGEIDWITELPDSESLDWHHRPTGGDGRIFVLPRDGPSTLYAIDEATGDLLQQRELDGFTQYAPAYADGTLFTVHGGQEMPVVTEAINAEDLSTEWRDETETLFNSHSPIVLGDMVVARVGLFIKGFEATDGQVRWRFSFEDWAEDEGLLESGEMNELWEWPLGPIMLGDTLYVWSSDRSIFAFQER